MAFMDETTELEVEKNKAIRGYIVRALARGNNGALLVRQIVNALMADNLIMTPDIGKYLKYLEDGGYIEFTSRSVNACWRTPGTRSRTFPPRWDTATEIISARVLKSLQG